MKKQFAVILNSETQKIDVISLQDKPKRTDVEEYIEETLNYSLSNCQWFVTKDILLHHIN